MFTIRKKFKFEAAHRLKTAFSKACVNQIHGHSYIVEVMLQSETLNEDGMVLDFGKLKAVIGDYINSWDHSLILHKSEVTKAIRRDNERLIVTKYNPTAEEMARDMFHYIAIKLTVPCVHLVEVRIHETDTGWASYTP